MCVLGAAPFAACGFIRYHGMTAEQTLCAMIKSEFMFPKRLVFRSNSLYYQALEEAILRGEPPPRKRVKRKQKPADTNH